MIQGKPAHEQIPVAEDHADVGRPEQERTGQGAGGKEVGCIRVDVVQSQCLIGQWQQSQRQPDQPRQDQEDTARCRRSRRKQP